VPPSPTPLTLAVRVYPEPQHKKQKLYSQKFWRIPSAMLVLDTETRTDATQRLTFGSYRFYKDGHCLEEGLFFGDDLPKRDQRILERYVSRHNADFQAESRRRLLLLTRNQFLKKLYQAAYKGQCLLVGFNLPFDLSRIAFNSSAARGRFAGGFSLGLWSYIDAFGCEMANHFRPRIGIKQIDSKRALKGFTSRRNPDREDLVLDEAFKGSTFRGHFLDLRTLAFALTDKSYSLASACEDFGVEHGKEIVTRHGEVTEKYVNYNRRDVLATAELAGRLLNEYAKHPIALQVTKAYSPASIGKAYLRAMGIKPILERQPDFPKQYLGFAQSAFFGGRTSAHIRKVAVPVVYTDFLSMYPTVNSLIDLWRFVTAREIIVVKDCKAEIETFLGSLSARNLFKPAAWKRMAGFVKIVPNGDILPSRGKYNLETKDWQVAVNYLYAEDNNPNQGLWFSLPDVAAFVLLTGRIPKIVDAFRIEPRGTLSVLKSTALRGTITIDPRRQDFFKVVIEERKRLSSRGDLSPTEKKRLDKALKVLANAASYGIYAEMNRRETEEKISVVCHGIDPEPHTCRVTHPDDPGEYCFPPLASLITGGARLMLALLEHCVAELGGTYAMEDTDSMAIVAVEQGGMVPCQGGLHRTTDGREGVKALSWEEVREISQRFGALNPYDKTAVPGSILKIEEDNFAPATGKQRQLFCVAISAKRYALFLLDNQDRPVLLRSGVNNKDDRWSEHGLGHLLNPSEPDKDDREWIAQAWLGIVRRAVGLPTKDLGFEDAPAVGRLSISSPAVLKPLENLNARKKYADQIKPFNFLLACHVKQLGHPIGVDPERFHLVAPYESDSRKWLKTYWIDQYSGRRYRITTAGHHGSRQTARVKTYGDVLREYEFHPESKCADAGGNPCGKQTIGLLQRRHVQIDLIKYIGKESNSMEDVESGLVHSAGSVYTEYSDPRRDEWRTSILPALKKVPLKLLVKKSGMSRRALIDARGERSRPHRKNRELLTTIVRELEVIQELTN
jgi:hypothetical protein